MYEMGRNERQEGKRKTELGHGSKTSPEARGEERKTRRTVEDGMEN